MFDLDEISFKTLKLSQSTDQEVSKILIRFVDCLKVVIWSFSTLKMLSLGVGDQHWLKQFPKFKKFQILCLQRFAPEIPTISQNCIQKIAKCRHLRVIDIAFFKLDDAKALLDIARSCPLLQKFSVRHLGFREKPELAENLYIELLRALPRLEHFELDLRFRINDASFQDFAHHCPQLTVPALPWARLCLSLTLLAEAHLSTG